jgi:Bacterial HORMA domain 2
MSSFVTVNTYAHSVTHVADNMIHSLHQIIRESGLSPEKLVDEWSSLRRAISTWLNSQHLRTVILEVYDPAVGFPGGLIAPRWDFEVSYGPGGDGSMWVNTEDIKYHIRKAGKWPSQCEYRVVLVTSPNEPYVSGWSDTYLRSTEGFVRQGIGTTIDGNGYITAGSAYWRKK